MTKKAIAKTIGEKGLSVSKLEKLPKTKAAVETAAESLEDFQMRRIYYVAEEILKNGEPFRRWNIIEKAGLNRRYSARISEEIDNILYKQTDSYLQTSLFCKSSRVRSV